MCDPGPRGQPGTSAAVQGRTWRTVILSFPCCANSGQYADTLSNSHPCEESLCQVSQGVGYAAGSDSDPFVSINRIVLSSSTGFHSAASLRWLGQSGKVAPWPMTISALQHWLLYTPNSWFTSPFCGTTPPESRALSINMSNPRKKAFSRVYCGNRITFGRKMSFTGPKTVSLSVEVDLTNVTTQASPSWILRPSICLNL